MLAVAISYLQCFPQEHLPCCRCLSACYLPSLLYSEGFPRPKRSVLALPASSPAHPAASRDARLHSTHARCETCLPSGIGHPRPQHDTVNASAACRAHHPAVPCHRGLQRRSGPVCSRSARVGLPTLKEPHLAAVGRIYSTPYRRAPLHDRRHSSGFRRVVLACGGHVLRCGSCAGCRRHRALAERDAPGRAALVGFPLLRVHPQAPDPGYHRPPRGPAGHSRASMGRRSTGARSTWGGPSSQTSRCS